MTSVLIKRRNLYADHTGNVNMSTETKVMCLQATECRRQPANHWNWGQGEREVEERWEAVTDLLSSPSEETSPANLNFVLLAFRTDISAL